MVVGHGERIAAGGRDLLEHLRGVGLPILGQPLDLRDRVFEDFIIGPVYAP